MKKISFLILAAFLIFSEGTTAKENLLQRDISRHISIPNEAIASPVLKNARIANQMLLDVNANNVKPQDKFQADGDIPVYIGLSYLGGLKDALEGSLNTPLVYEPYTKALIFFALERMRVDNEADTIAERGVIYFTQDLGKTWDSIGVSLDTIVWTAANESPYQNMYPTVTVTNPTKSTNIADILISTHLKRITFGAIQSDGSRLSESVRSRFYFIKGKGNGTKNARIVSFDRPNGNNNNDYDFWHMRGTGISVNGKAYGLFGGYASKPTERTEPRTTSSYSFAVANLSPEGEFDDQNVLSSKLLPTSFVFPDNLVNSRDGIFSNETRTAVVLAPMSIDADTAGNVYAAFNSFTNGRFFDDNTPGADYKKIRVPLVMRAKVADMTDDNNFTFTATDSLPESVVMEFLNNHSYKTGQTDNAWAFNRFNDGVYSAIPFVVGGVNRYSFFLPMSFIYLDEFGNDKGYSHFVEVSNDNGNWAIRSVYSLPDSAHLVRYYDEAAAKGTRAPCDIQNYSTAAGTFIGPMLDFDYTDELQISKTVDGEYYVAKWLAYYHDTDFVNIETKNMYFTNMYVAQDAKQDTASMDINKFYINRLYLAYRHKDSANWSTPVRAYKNDTIPMRGTNMPAIVPSINEVPITIAYGQNQAYTQGPNGNPVVYNKLQADLKLPLLIHSVSDVYHSGVLIIADAQNDYTGIVEGKESTTYCLENAYPNPAFNGSKINFKFSLQTPAQTKLVVYNSMGQVVATLVDQYCNAREYDVDLHSASLPNGAYYFTLTSGSIVETKMFNIVR